jgi:hypothetical protein
MLMIRWLNFDWTSLLAIGFLIVWFILARFILPRLGVST